MPVMSHNRVYPDPQGVRMFRLLCCLSVALAAHGATPLFQTSFENSDQGWTAVRGNATLDSTVLHGDNKSLRLEPAKSGDGPVVRFAPLALTIGKRYELSGWARTENLAVKDLDRSPIAVGGRADHGFHAVGRPLRVAGRYSAVDPAIFAIRRQPGAGCDPADSRQRRTMRGKAWFEGVSLDEVSSADAWPVREAVETFGPPIVIRPRAGFTCTSKASLTNAATSTAI